MTILSPASLKRIHEADNPTACLATEIERAVENDRWTLAQQYGQNLVRACRTGAWAGVLDDFKERRFVRDDQDVLIAAPYTDRRTAQSVLLIVAGKLRELPRLPFPDVPDLVRLRKNAADLPLMVVDPIEHGWNSHDAFITPVFWAFSQDASGDAFLHAKMIRNQLVRQGLPVLERMLDGPSYEAIQSRHQDPTLSEALIIMEYLLHERGHSAGVGYNQRVNHEAMSELENRVAEEVGSDLRALHQCHHTQKNPMTVLDWLATNMLIRIGCDAQRPASNHDPDGEAGRQMRRLLAKTNTLIPASTNGKSQSARWRVPCLVDETLPQELLHVANTVYQATVDEVDAPDSLTFVRQNCLSPPL